jgi:hypothetical protein
MWDFLVQEVFDLAEILASEAETEQTADALWQSRGFIEAGWHADRSVRGVDIRIPQPRNKAIFPRNSQISEAYLNFFVKVGGGVDAAGLLPHSEFQVCVRGFVEYDHCVVQLEDHWRIDTHDFSGTPNEPHPLVHFQRGGHAQDAWASHAFFVPGSQLPEKQDDFWRSTFQSPGPRVPFLPFCPVLALDYLIGQHDGDIFKRLRSKPEYLEIVRNAQRRLWQPFFQRLANAENQRKWLGDMLVQ